MVAVSIAGESDCPCGGAGGNRVSLDEMEGSVKEGDDLGSGDGSVRIEAVRGYSPGDVVGDRPSYGLVGPMSGRDVNEGV